MHPTAPLEDGDTNLRASLWLCATILLCFAVVCGGASRENPLRLAAVEVASLPVLFLLAPRWRRLRAPRGAIAALLLLTLIIALPLVQLIPLPAALWTRLPGRTPELAALNAAGVAAPWLPISLAPAATTSAALALSPPAAMFLAALIARPRGARWLAGGWTALGLASLVLGAAQVAIAGPSPVYPYAETNYGSLVGFFANRNHEAAFLLALLPFAAMFTAPAPSSARAGGAGRWLAALAMFLSVVGLGVVRSRAGVLLVGPTLVGCAALVFRTRAARSAMPAVAALVGVGLAVTAVAVFALAPILNRFDATAPAEFRFEAWPVVATAAKTFQPVGAGVGAFDRVFRAAEPPAMIGPTYFNHAHNDWLELWLETGVAGALLAAAFLVWLGFASWRAWRPGAGGEAALARAASVSILVLLACSVVDYPLRTESLACLFAWSCGLLAGRRTRAA